MAGFKKTAAKSRARNIAWGRTYEALNGRKMTPTHYRVIWYFKGPRPDADNCLACCKAYLDGACKALGIDDRTLDCAGIDRVHDLARAGQVEIVFERSLLTACLYIQKPLKINTVQGRKIQLSPASGEGAKETEGI